MNPIKKSTTVQLKVRLKEPLRARIEKAARKQEHPMNTEIVDRLEMSFSEDEKLQLTHQIVMDGVYEQFGGIGTYSIMKLLTEAIRYIEDETGKSWQDDRNTYEQVETACKVILSRYGPEAVRRTEPALDPLQLGEHVASVLVTVRGESKTRAQLEEDRKRRFEDKTQ